MNILVIAELEGANGGEVAPATFELLGKALELAAGGRVDCLVQGAGTAALAPVFFARGASRV